MTVIDRRSLLQRAFALAGATLAPGFTVEALAQAAAQAPRLLDAPHFELLAAVSDTIVPRTDTPGAVDAGVPKAFDAMLRDWASPQHRQDLIGALEAIDQHARHEHRQPFAKLPAAKRHAVLAAHDAAALKPPAVPAPPAAKTAASAPPPAVVDPNYGRAKQEPPQTRQAGESISVMAGPPVTDPAYAKLKELVVTLYYVSEQALTSELSYEHSPGAYQPSVPVTPATRPSGGLAYT